MFGLLPVSALPAKQYTAAPAIAGGHREARARRQGKFIRRRDALAILLVGLVSACVSMFVAPHTGYASTPELLYYTVYDVAVGAVIGFYLFDRLPKHGFAFFAASAASAILFGTLVNEAVVEPMIFGTGPINGEGFYYGLTDSLWTTVAFLLLRLVEGQRVLQQPVYSEPQARSRLGAGQDADSACFFVRVPGGTRRIHAADVLYLAAERDFTRIVCAEGEHFVSESLKKLLGKAGELGLVRVHKSYAVNLSRVERLNRTEVQLGAFRVPVGRRYWPAFAEAWRTRSAPAARH